MKKLWKKWLSWVLVIALSLTLMPTTLLPGAMAAKDLFTISNGTISDDGNWTLTVNGVGNTGTVMLYIVLDAKQAGGMTPSEMQEVGGLFGSRLSAAASTFDGVGLSGLYWQGPSGSVSGGHTYDSNNVGVDKCSLTFDVIRAAINNGAVLYDKNNRQLLATDATYPVLFLFNAGTADSDDEQKIITNFSSPGKLELSNALTVKTDSSAAIPLGNAQVVPDPAADTTYNIGGKTATITNKGDGDVVIVTLKSGATAGAWKYSVDSSMATPNGLDLKPTGGITIAGHGTKTIPLIYNNATAAVLNTISNASGVFELVYTTNTSDLTDTTSYQTLQIPWSFKRTSGITATPIVINTTTTALAAGPVTGQTTVTIPAAVVATGKYKFPTSIVISGTDSGKFTTPVPATATNPQITLGGVINQTTTTASGDYTFTVTVTAKQGTVAPGTYTAAINNWMFANTGAPVPTPPTYTLAIPITLNVVDGGTPPPVTYNVTYNGNGATGGSVPTDSNAYTAGSTVIVKGNTGNLVKTGHTFAGWSYNGTTYQANGTFTMPAGNVTLTAVWTANEYVIKYLGNGGTGSMNDTASTNQSATVAANGFTAPTGKTFDKWNTAANGSGTDYDPSDVISNMTGDVTLYAQWKDIDYTVTFNTNKGSRPGTVQNAPAQLTGKHYNDALTAPTPAPSLAGYTFGGWYKEAACTTPWNFSTDKMPANDLILYAKWDTATYSPTVTVYVDGTATNVTSVQLMTSNSDTYGNPVTTGASGVYTFNNTSSMQQNGTTALTFSHAKVVTTSGTYVAALNQTISYTGNQSAEVYLQTVKVVTAPTAAAVSEGSALSAGISGNGTNTGVTTIIAPSGTYNITTATTNSLYQFKNWTGGTVASATTMGTTYALTATKTGSAVTLTANWRGIDAESDVSTAVKEGYPNAVTVLDSSTTPAGTVKNIGMEATGTLATKVTATDSFTDTNAGTLGAKLTVTLGGTTINSGASTDLTVTVGTGLTAASANAPQVYTAYVWVYDSVTNVIRDRVKIDFTVNPPAGMTLTSNYDWDTYTQTIYQSTATTKTLTVQYDDMTSVTGITMPSGAALPGFTSSQATITNAGATGATATIILTKAQLIAIAADIRSQGGTSGRVTVSATGGSGAKSAAITATLKDSMPYITKTEFTGVTGSGANKTWSLGGTFPGVKDTDSKNNTTGSLTGTVVHKWYVNGAVFGTDGLTAPTSADLSVGDVVKVEAYGTGEAWTAKPASGDNYAKTPVQSDTFTVAAPTVTVQVKVDNGTPSTTSTDPSASASHVGAGVFNATTTGTATKYRFVNWTLVSGTGGYANGSGGYNAATASSQTTLFKPTTAATIQANYKSIAHLIFNNGAAGTGPNDTNGTKYTDTVTNDGAAQATSVTIALADAGTSGTAAKFDVAFTPTTTTVAAGAGAPFTVTPKANTDPGTYTFKVQVTYKEHPDDTTTKTIEQVLTYTVPKRMYTVKLVGNTTGTITGSYGTANPTTGTSGTAANDDKTIQVEEGGYVSLTATANTGYKFVKFESTATASTGKNTLSSATSASTSYGAVYANTEISAQFKAVTDLSESHTKDSDTQAVGYSGTPNVYTGKVFNAGAKAGSATLTLSNTTHFELDTSTPISISAFNSTGVEVKVKAKGNLPTGTYNTTLTIQEVGDADDTKTGVLFQKVIPITFTVGSAKAGVTVKLDAAFCNNEAVTLKPATGAAVAMTAPTSGNNYTADGLIPATAYSILVNGVDTGVDVTTGQVGATASGAVQLWSLTLQTDPATCAIKPVASGGTSVTVTPAGGTASVGYIAGGSVSITAAVYNTASNVVYKFNQWKDDASGSTNPLSYTIPASASTVTAEYETTFGVKYWKNLDASTRPGASNTPYLDDNNNYTSSSTIGLAVGPTETGKVFKGWGVAQGSTTALTGPSTNKTAIETAGGTLSNGVFNLYAIWETVSYTWDQDATKALTDGMYGVAYGDSVVGGGVKDQNGAPVAVIYRLAAGQTLPEGLTLNKDGSISGKPYVTYVTTPKSFQVEAVMGANADGTGGTVVGSAKTFTIKVDKYTPVLNVSSVTGVTAGGPTSGAKLTGTVDAPYYTGSAWVVVQNKLGLNDSFTDVTSGGVTAKPSGTVAITAPANFNASSATTCTITYTPGAQTTGATGQNTQKFSDIYNPATADYTATLGALTYDFSVAPASQLFTVTQDLTNYDPANKLFDITYTGNQAAYLKCSWATTDNNDKFRLEALTDTASDGTKSPTLAVAAGGEVVTGAIKVTPRFNTTVGTYTATVKVEAYDNAAGTGTAKYTQFVTLILEVKAPTDFVPTVKVYKQAVGGADTLTTITGVQLISLADGTTALAADTPTTAGTYTWTTNKPVYGTAYKVQIKEGQYTAWTDTGVTLSVSDMTNKEVHLYEIKLATDPTGVGASLSLNGTAYTAGVYVLNGETVSALTDEPNGHTFSEWNDGTSQLSTTMLTNYTVNGAPATLTAKFVQNYTVKFDGNGADTFTVGGNAYTDALAANMLVGGVNSYADGATIGVQGTSAYNITKSGATFRGWALKGDTTGVYSFTANEANDKKDNATADHVIVLYAVWTTDSTLALSPAVITGTYKHPTLTKTGGAVSGGTGATTIAAAAPIPFGITYTASNDTFTGVQNSTPNDTGNDTCDFKVTDAAGGEAHATYTFIIGKADVTPSTTAGEGLPTNNELPVGGVTATAITNLFGNTKMNGVDTGENDVKGTWSVQNGYTLPTTPGTYTVPVVFTPENQGQNPTGVDKYGDHYNTYTTTIQVKVKAKEITFATLDVTAPVVNATPMTATQLIALTTNTLTSAGNNPTYSTATAVKDVKIAAVTWSPADTAFQGGTDYTVRVTLEIEQGSDYIFADNIDGEIAGHTATVEAHNATTVTLAYTFPKKINVIDVTADVLVAGNATAAVSVPPAHQNEYDLVSYKWVEKGTNTEVTAANPFDKDKLYDLIVEVKKKDNIDFVSDITNINAAGANMTTPKQLATVNTANPPEDGKVAKSEGGGYNSATGTITIRYNAFKPIEKQIKDIYVEGTPGAYYAKTAVSGDKHNDANATGNKSGVGFNFSAGGITVYPIYEDGTRGTTPLTTGYTIGKRDMSQATPTFTALADGYTFVKNASTDDVDNWDGQTLWVKYTVNGVDKYAAVGGSLVVKELEVDSISLSAAPTLTYQTGDTFTAAGTATVGFNSAVPGLKNEVANRTAASVTYGPEAAAAAGDTRPNFYYKLDGNNDGDVLDTEDTLLVPGTTVITADMRGKTVYGCYTDVNGHLVTVRLGNIDFTSTGLNVNITDENGRDPEYGDKLTATPDGGVGPYTYQWVIPGGNPDGSDKVLGTDSTYVPTGTDIGKTIKVIVTDSTGATAEREIGPIKPRSLNFTVAPKNKKEDGDKLNYTGDKPASGGGAGYTSDDFTLLVATDSNGVFGGVLNADANKVTLDLKAALDILGTESGTATAQRPMYAANTAGSKIIWPAVAVDTTTVATDKTGGYELSGDNAAYYRLAAQGEIADRGTITAGDGIVHVDVHLNAPKNGQGADAAPTKVTSLAETTWGTGSGFSLTWYKTADFNANDLTANTVTSFEDNTQYTVVTPVKPVDGKKYDDNATEFWFHVNGGGESAQVTLKSAADINTADANGKKTGVLKKDGVYYMVYTFAATGSTANPIPTSIKADALATTLYYATTTGHNQAAVTAGNIMGDVRPTPFVFDATGSTTVTVTDSQGSTASKPTTRYELETVSGGSSTFTTITAGTTTFTAADDGKKVYAVYDDGTNPALKAYIGTLTVKELTAEVITPTIGANGVKLNYAATSDLTLDLSGVTGAEVKFNQGTTAIAKDENPTYAANASKTSDNYYYEYHNGTDYVGIDNGATLDPATHDGKNLYICYTDVNNHTVRALLGTLTVKTAATLTGITATPLDETLYYVTTKGVANAKNPGHNEADRAQAPGDKNTVSFAFTTNGVTVTKVMSDGTTAAPQASELSYYVRVDATDPTQDVAITAGTTFLNTNYDGKQVYVKCGDQEAYVGTLAIRYLTAERITPKLNANGVKLSYSVGDMVLDLSGVEGAKVNFNMDTAEINTEYETNTAAGTLTYAANDHGETHYFFQVRENDGTFTDMADGTTLTAGDDGKTIYICYEDVNETIVRAAIGTLAVNDENGSTAAIRLENQTHANENTQYGDSLKVIPSGTSGEVKYTWQISNDGSTNWTELDSTNMKDTATDIWAAEKYVGKYVRVQLTKDGDKDVSGGIYSNVLKIEPKKITIPYTWLTGSKTYDATTAVPNAATTVVPDSDWTDQLVARDNGKITVKAFTSAAFDTAAVGTNKDITLTFADTARLETTDSTNNPVSNYIVTVVEPKGAITQLRLTWDMFDFEPKVKRYDGNTDVYKVDNYDLVKENTDSSLTGQQRYTTVAYGTGKADNGLWGLKNNVASDLVTAITGEVQVASVAYGSAASLQPRGNHVADATEKATEGRSVLKVTLGYVNASANHNFTLPTGEFIVEHSAINPKQITVGAADLTLSPIAKDATGITLNGEVSDGRKVTTDTQNVKFSVLGAVKQPVEGTTATVTIKDVSENSSNGINWQDNNYKLVWDDTTEVKPPVIGGEVESITVESIERVMYGNNTSGLKVVAKVKYQGTPAPDNASEYTFASLANMNIKAIVAHDVNGDRTVGEYAFAGDSATKAGWDNGNGTTASLNVKFFKAADATAADTTNYNKTPIGTGTIGVDPRPLNVAATWKIDNQADHQSKFYDNAKTAVGNVWDAQVTPLAPSAGNVGSMTYTYTGWAFADDDGKAAVNTGAGFSAEFTDVNVGVDKTIKVELASTPFTGTLANRYIKGNVENAKGTIVARPVTVTFDKQSVLKGADVTVNLRKELTAADGLMAGDSFTVAAVGTYTTDSANPHVYDGTSIVGDFIGNVTVTDPVWNNSNYAVTATSPINGEVVEPTPSKHPYLDVVVEASQPTEKGVTLTGPTVDATRPYELIDSGSKWQYYTGAGWADVAPGTGLDASGKTLADTEYRVVAKVQLKADERDKYYLSTSTGFKLAGKDCSTGTATTHPDTMGANQLNPSASADATTNRYADDTTYVLIQTFKTPKDEIVPDTEILDVNVFFKDQPADGGTIPTKPNDVRNSEKETMPGENGATDFTATWYVNDNNAAFNPASTSANGWTTAGNEFKAGKYYTVAVKVKAQDGYTYVLDKDTHDKDTKFIFHFGQNDTVEVVKTTVTPGAGMVHGLYSADNTVYTMYYTFQVPAGEIDQITAVDGTFVNPNYSTKAHTAANTGSTTGAKPGVGFQMDYTINSITVHYKGEPASTTHTILSTTTVPAEQAILAQVKAYVSNDAVTTAKPFDPALALDDGYTFTQTTNDGSTKTSTGRFDDKKVRVSIGNVVSPVNVTLKDANDATKDTLVVRELEVYDIEPVYKTGETAIKLSYANGDAFDPSNITDATVNFLTDENGLKVENVTIADEMTSNTGTDQTKYYYELDNGTRLKTGDTMTYAGMNGRDLYICYTDVNGHKVRALLGTLKVSAPEDPVIVKVAANVKQPIVGQTIADASASVLLAISADNRDVTDKVETGTVTWTNVTTPGAALGTTFQTGGSYKAEFDVKIKAGNTTNKFIKDTATPDYLDLLINGVSHSDKSWLDIKNANPAAGQDTETVGADGSINQIKVDVKPTSTGSEETSYRVTVTFNKISDKANLLAVLGTAKTPKADDPIDVANIKPLDGQPYQLVAGSNKWYEADGTTAASGSFKPGKSYWAELEVELKDSEKPYYQFTQTTDGNINGDSATVVSRDPTTGEPTKIKLKLKFDVKPEPINVVASSTEPTKGATAAAMNATIKDGKNGAGHYTIDLTKAYWADASGNKMNDTDTFTAPGNYKLVLESVKPDEGYTLTTDGKDYSWLETGRQGVNVRANGDGTYRVEFPYNIPSEGGARDPIINVDTPKKGNTPGVPEPKNITIKKDDTGKDIYTWTEKGSSTPMTGTFQEGKDYVINIEIEPARPDGTGDWREGDKVEVDGKWVDVHIKTDAEGNKTYYVEREWHIDKTTINQTVSGGGGGGGGGTVELPQVFYKLGETGVTDDLTAEKVKVNGKPSKVPKVEGLKIQEKDGSTKTYTFVGWSETDPAKTTGTPVLVDPTTFKITKDKTFYAVYEIQGHTAIDHTHYVIGFPNGTFGPGADITRGEVATIIARACLDGFIEGANYGNPGGYSDVERHWAYSAISYCSINNVFTGYTDGTFRPDQPITRQELAVVVARINNLIANQGMPFTDVDDISKWALDGVYTAYAKGWINGYKDGSFKPLQNITRAEAVKVFNGFLSRGVDTEGLSEMREYVHDGVASNNRENGYDQYMTWPDVPKNHWAYYEIIEAANDHTCYWLDETNPVPPEHWTSVWIDEIWNYHDDSTDGARPTNPDTTTPQY